MAAGMDLLRFTVTGAIHTNAPLHLSRTPHPSLSLEPSYLSAFHPAKARLSFKKAPPLPRRFSASASISPSKAVAANPCVGWVVVTEKPPIAGDLKPAVIDYYVQTLARVLASEKEAQKCIYDASWQTHFGFCCDISEESSRELASVPGVLLVKPDKDPDSKNKDYSYSNILLGQQSKSDACTSRFSPSGSNSEYWIVRLEKPGVEVVTKAQMVDYYAQTLTKVLGNEQDAQMRIYNISWEKDLGFCCQIDEECARELADVPGVLSVRPDVNFESENKDYKGIDTSQNSKDASDLSETSLTPEVKTKRLFVTGLSFYTSEKTLRLAFEGFGELVEVKIIMDKISKRSKGYAFLEYTTVEAAGQALREMNGKIINGWMIVVDVAKTNPTKFNSRSVRPFSSSPSSNQVA